MVVSRRTFVGAAAAAATLGTGVADADGYPSRPVRFLVGFGPGGAPDILARLVGNWLADRMHGQFVIENRPGAGSNIAADAVAHAVPDGHALLLTGMGQAVNASLYGNLNYDFLRDLAPVAGISREPLAVVVQPSFAARSMAEFIDAARRSPGTISYGSAGSGSSLHMVPELFKMTTGVDLVHVPYRASAAAVSGLLGGQVQTVFCPLPSSIELVRSGALRALATTGAVRSAALPEVPTVGETVSGFEGTAFYGVCTTTGTPAAVVDVLNAAVNAGLADATLKARLDDLGSVPFVATPAAFGNYLAAETDKWSRVVKAGNLRPQ